MAWTKQYPAIDEVRGPEVDIRMDADLLYELRPYLLFVAGFFIFLSLILLLLS